MSRQLIADAATLIATAQPKALAKACRNTGAYLYLRCIGMHAYGSQWVVEICLIYIYIP